MKLLDLEYGQIVVLGTDVNGNPERWKVAYVDERTRAFSLERLMPVTLHLPPEAAALLTKVGDPAPRPRAAGS